MKILPFSAWYPEIHKISSPDTFFGTVKERYTEYHQEGYFKKMPQEALYIYRIVTNDASSTGVLATLPIEEYNKGNILKHEQTLSRKEEKTVQLVLERMASIKPILLTYPSVSTINKALAQWIQTHPPLFSTHFDVEQTSHQIWSIEDKSLIKQLQDLFQASVPTTYIADGHHRTSTMSLLQARNGNVAPAADFSKLMVALFASDQLNISVFSRIVDIRPQFTHRDFLDALKKYCTLQRLTHYQKPTQKQQFILIADTHYWLCSWKEALRQEYQDQPTLLDVQLLNEKILDQLLGIKDFRTDKRIQYLPDTEGIKGLELALLKQPNHVGFYLHPISITDLMTVVNQQAVLPPKSTFFEPRMKNGLLVRRFIEE